MTFRNSVSLAACALLAACPGGGGKKGGGNGVGVGTGDGTGDGPAPGTTQVSLADVGLESRSIDRSVDACTDFYQYACGGWLDAHTIPPDRARWGRFSEVQERNEVALHAILEEARAGGSDDPIMARLGDYYGSCMDEDGIEKAGLTGIKPLLDRIKKVKDRGTLAAALIALHNAGIKVVFDAAAEGDFADSTKNIMWIDTTGLGLPDRDYYFGDDFEPKLTAYREHLVRLFGLLGRNAKQADAAAANVLAVETRLADATKTSVQRRNYGDLYNPHDLAALAKAMPKSKFDWKAYFKGRGSADQPKISVTTPAYLARMDELFATVKPAQWQDYLTARLVDEMAFALPKRFDDEKFALDRALSGVEQQRDRYKRCIEATDKAMPEALGQPYIDRMFPGNSKQAATEMVAEIARAFDAEIDQLDWMSADTRTAARGKLAKLSGLIGYPDRWREYTFDVSATNFAANQLAAATFEVRRQFHKAGKPYDRSEWLMPAYIVNAYYNPIANNTALPAGILQPPFFGHDRSIPANLGGIGMVVGHELTHGFDDQGARFDADGNMTMWWQQADFEKFQAKGKCVVDQYAKFEVLPGKFVDGNLTLGENIADLGGVKLAYRAYRNLRRDADRRYVAEGFDEDQQFFLAVGQAWCSKDRDDEALRRLTTDSHSPPRWRVNGVMRNLPEFSAAFGCKAGAKMRPAKTCSVW
jgi:putative endopeptidase